jgi:sugar/nucleoside kinase (ribokinase family)
MKWLWIHLIAAQIGAAERNLVMGTGASTIDFLVPAEKQFIEQYLADHEGGSFESSFDHLCWVLEQVEKAPKIVPGGSSANTIRALTKLGEPTAFLGDVGKDQWGELFSLNLKNLGIDSRLRESSFTSLVLCLISPDGQRSFLAANPEIEDLSISEEELNGVKWLHLEARRLMYPGYVEEVMKLAAQLDIKISMDLSSFEVVQQHKETLLFLIANYVDIVFCNQDEIFALTKSPPEEGCLSLQELCPVAVVTLGRNGCLIGSGGNLWAVPTFIANVVDTTGAGDYFAAGFLYGYLHKLPVETCGLIGNRLGSAVVEILGAELPEKTWDELRNWVSYSREKIDL